jgi:hypothetical protein
MWTLSPDKVDAKLGMEGSSLQRDRGSLMVLLLQDVPAELLPQLQPIPIPIAN